VSAFSSASPRSVPRSSYVAKHPRRTEQLCRRASARGDEAERLQHICDLGLHQGQPLLQRTATTPTSLRSRSLLLLLPPSTTATTSRTATRSLRCSRYWRPRRHANSLEARSTRARRSTTGSSAGQSGPAQTAQSTSSTPPCHHTRRMIQCSAPFPCPSGAPWSVCLTTATARACGRSALLPVSEWPWLP
jgi:hypothetical protein